MFSDEKILISVVMPMYNSELYVQEALTCLQNQTYKNFEVIIIDNCSTDHSIEIVEQMNDERFHVYINEENKGLLYSLQRGVSLARGKYIARLDSDDVCEPQRLEKQVQYMEEHEDVMLCGCEGYTIIEGKRYEGSKSPIYGKYALKFSLLYKNYCLIHSAFMFRRKELENAGIRYEKFQHCQDYHMSLAVSEKYELYVLPEKLVGYRVHAAQLTQTDSNDLVKTEENALKKIYMEHIGLEKKYQDILLKANAEAMLGCKDIERFIELMERHAELIGVNIKQKDTDEYLCAQFVLWDICTTQIHRDIRLLWKYITSHYRNLKWLLGYKEGFLWALCCICSYDVRGKKR
ncbi:MAG: glycosyltransferase [Ruminococcus sp.]|nr:glycosyltransferase [Ruminococcus sp.]